MLTSSRTATPVMPLCRSLASSLASSASIPPSTATISPSPPPERSAEMPISRERAGLCRTTARVSSSE
ncbi:hypothetical protein [Nonomuraea rubra]|uniref:hypothetical protein n=1 Tax=Nonomuraea rubra TaxID=46180 RepID=UPI0031E83A14